MPRLACLLSAILLASTVSTHPAAADSLADAVRHAMGATVGILDDVGDHAASPRQAQVSVRGTGVHLGDGYIVTARHVVERPERGAAEPTLPEQIRVLTTGLEELPAQLSSGSAFLDLVVYQVPADSRAVLPAVAAFTESQSDAGQEVFTVGYPLGWGPAVAYGRVGNPSVFLPTVETRLLQADLSVCSGNSGGGLFDSAGRLVGLMHAIIQTEHGKETLGNERCSRFAFAVPTPLARRIIEAIKHGEPPAFSRLGIRMNTIRDGGRWVITAAEVAAPALTGGVKKGDVLLAIDGTAIKDPAHLKNYLMERTVPGQRVVLRIRRGDRDLELTITLGRG